MDQTISLSAILDELAGLIAAKINIPSQTSPGQSSRLLDVRAAAAYLSVTEHSIRHQIAKGQLPVVRRGSRVFVDRRDLDRTIDQSKDTAVQ